MSTVLLTGGSGLIGSQLSKKLKEKGYDVFILSRTRDNKQDIPAYFWNPEKMEIEKEAIETADYIIHLAGTNIGEKRWTAKRKKGIIESRVETAELIFDSVKKNHKNIKAFISASAIGYYGSITSDKIFTEADLPYDDFLGNTCLQWEQSADKFNELGIRTVKIRTGIVLTKSGGVLSRFLTTAKLGIGSPLGNGKQYMPWIHIDDLCDIYIKAIEDDSMTGAYNAVAPIHVTNKEFSQLVSYTLHKPFWFPNIPAFILKLIFGNMSVMILEGSRVSCEKILQSGYNFHFSNLEQALTDLIENKED